MTDKPKTTDMSGTQEWRPCYICGEKVLWQTNGVGWHPIQYHDCKPVPRAKLEQAERERDEANEACREKQAIIERMLESERQAVALLREVEFRGSQGECVCCGYAKHTVDCGIGSFLAGQPAPAKPVVDDAMVFRLCAELYYRGYNIGPIGARAALVAALEGRT